MYQTVGHHAVEMYAEAMSLPLYRRVIEGSSKQIGKYYSPTTDDEVEDLYELLKTVKVGYIFVVCVLEKSNLTENSVVLFL